MSLNYDHQLLLYTSKCRALIYWLESSSQYSTPSSITTQNSSTINNTTIDFSILDIFISLFKIELEFFDSFRYPTPKPYHVLPLSLHTFVTVILLRYKNTLLTAALAIKYGFSTILSPSLTKSNAINSNIVNNSLFLPYEALYAHLYNDKDFGDSVNQPPELHLTTSSQLHKLDSSQKNRIHAKQTQLSRALNDISDIAPDYEFIHDMLTSLLLPLCIDLYIHHQLQQQLRHSINNILPSRQCSPRLLQTLMNQLPFQPTPLATQLNSSSTDLTTPFLDTISTTSLSYNINAGGSLNGIFYHISQINKPQQSITPQSHNEPNGPNGPDDHVLQQVDTIEYQFRSYASPQLQSFLLTLFTTLSQRETKIDQPLPSSNSTQQQRDTSRTELIQTFLRSFPLDECLSLFTQKQLVYFSFTLFNEIFLIYSARLAKLNIALSLLSPPIMSTQPLAVQKTAMLSLLSNQQLLQQFYLAPSLFSSCSSPPSSLTNISSFLASLISFPIQPLTSPTMTNAHMISVFTQSLLHHYLCSTPSQPLFTVSSTSTAASSLINSLSTFAHPFISTPFGSFLSFALQCLELICTKQIDTFVTTAHMSHKTLLKALLIPTLSTTTSPSVQSPLNNPKLSTHNATSKYFQYLQQQHNQQQHQPSISLIPSHLTQSDIKTTIIPTHFYPPAPVSEVAEAPPSTASTTPTPTTQPQLPQFSTNYTIPHRLLQLLQQQHQANQNLSSSSSSSQEPYSTNPNTYDKIFISSYPRFSSILGDLPIRLMLSVTPSIVFNSTLLTSLSSDFLQTITLIGCDYQDFSLNVLLFLPTKIHPQATPTKLPPKIDNSPSDFPSSLASLTSSMQHFIHSYFLHNLPNNISSSGTDQYLSYINAVGSDDVELDISDLFISSQPELQPFHSPQEPHISLTNLSTNLNTSSLVTPKIISLDPSIITTSLLQNFSTHRFPLNTSTSSSSQSLTPTLYLPSLIYSANPMNLLTSLMYGSPTLLKTYIVQLSVSFTTQIFDICSFQQFTTTLNYAQFLKSFKLQLQHEVISTLFPPAPSAPLSQYSSSSQYPSSVKSKKQPQSPLPPLLSFIPNHLSSELITLLKDFVLPCLTTAGHKHATQHNAAATATTTTSQISTLPLQLFFPNSINDFLAQLLSTISNIQSAPFPLHVLVMNQIHHTLLILLYIFHLVTKWSLNQAFLTHTDQVNLVISPQSTLPLTISPFLLSSTSLSGNTSHSHPHSHSRTTYTLHYNPQFDSYHHLHIHPLLPSFQPVLPITKSPHAQELLSYINQHLLAGNGQFIKQTLWDSILRQSFEHHQINTHPGTSPVIDPMIKLTFNPTHIEDAQLLSFAELANHQSRNKTIEAQYKSYYSYQTLLSIQTHSFLSHFERCITSFLTKLETILPFANQEQKQKQQQKQPPSQQNNTSQSITTTTTPAIFPVISISDSVDLCSDSTIDPIVLLQSHLFSLFSNFQQAINFSSTFLIKSIFTALVTNIQHTLSLVLYTAHPVTPYTPPTASISTSTSIEKVAQQPLPRFLVYSFTQLTTFFNIVFPLLFYNSIELKASQLGYSLESLYIASFNHFNNSSQLNFLTHIITLLTHRFVSILPLHLSSNDKDLDARRTHFCHFLAELKSRLLIPLSQIYSLSYIKHSRGETSSIVPSIFASTNAEPIITSISLTSFKNNLSAACSPSQHLLLHRELDTFFFSFSSLSSFSSSTSVDTSLDEEESTVSIDDDDNSDCIDRSRAHSFMKKYLTVPLLLSTQLISATSLLLICNRRQRVFIAITLFLSMYCQQNSKHTPPMPFLDWLSSSSSPLSPSSSYLSIDKSSINERAVSRLTHSNLTMTFQYLLSIANRTLKDHLLDHTNSQFQSHVNLDVNVISVISTIPLIDLFHFFIFSMAPLPIPLTDSTSLTSASSSSTSLSSTSTSSSSSADDTNKTLLQFQQSYPRPHIANNMLPVQYIDIVSNAVNYSQLFQHRSQTQTTSLKLEKLETLETSAQNPQIDFFSITDRYDRLESIQQLCHTSFSYILSSSSRTVSQIVESVSDVLQFFIIKEHNDKTLSYNPVSDVIFESQTRDHDLVGLFCIYAMILLMRSYK